MKTYLNVPFAEKDEARRLGAKWDLARKRWYTEDLEDLRPFMKWIPESLKLPSGPAPKRLKHSRPKTARAKKRE